MSKFYEKFRDDDKEPKVTSKHKPKKCPKCDSTNIAEIKYGYPIHNGNYGEDWLRGQVVYGGCVRCPDNPAWQCMSCQLNIHAEDGWF